MPYFFAQDPDYLELKKRVVRSVVHGGAAEGVVDIDLFPVPSGRGTRSRKNRRNPRLTYG